MRNLRVPDLTPEMAAPVAEVFEAHQDEELLRLYDSGADATRQALDTAVVDVLGADAETVTRVRNALAAEPSVQ